MAKNQSKIVYSPQQKAIRAVLWVVLALFAVLVIFPVVYIILGSFKEMQSFCAAAATFSRRTGSFRTISMHGIRRISQSIPRTVFF